MLKDPDAGVRVAAAGAVCQIEKNADGLIDILREALRKQDQRARITGRLHDREAATIASEMGRAARPLASELIDVLKRSWPNHSAITALERMGKLPPEALDRLDAEFDQFNPSHRDGVLCLPAVGTRGLERYVEIIENPELLSQNDRSARSVRVSHLETWANNDATFLWSSCGAGGYRSR